MIEPLYLTDAERPLRPPKVQHEYRFYLQFSLRGTWYTRWFKDPASRDAYASRMPGLVPMSKGEAQTPADVRKAFNSLDALRSIDVRHTKTDY